MVVAGRVGDAEVELHLVDEGWLGQHHAARALLTRAREVSDQKERVDLYRQAIDRIAARRNQLYLYHLNYIAAYPKNLKGYRAVPDGLIRIKGASWN